jgi:Uma2 family endonuclease
MLGAGPFRTEQLGGKSRYELSDGNAIFCSPSGGDGARGVVAGGLVLDTDPDVESSGFDAGFSPDAKNMRAPDIAVGNVPDRPGFVDGSPPLAVEYASTGQDEAELQTKIAELLDRGTRWVWVVRLLGARRVEVHEKGQPVRVRGVGDTLTAPGVLRNPVPVEALFDRDVAQDVALRNLLQRRGYEDLEDIRDEGREEGALIAARDGLEKVCAARGIPLTGAARARIAACRDVVRLQSWLVTVATDGHLPDLDAT